MNRSAKTNLVLATILWIILSVLLLYWASLSPKEPVPPITIPKVGPDCNGYSLVVVKCGGLNEQ